MDPTKATMATAYLPGLSIEIMHRRSAVGDGEQLSIHVQAVPSFEAFGSSVQSANPFALWAEAVRLAWLPWLAAARIMSLPLAAPPLLPWAGADPHGSSRGNRSSEQGQT
jgi:hypothetical protein